MFQRSSLPAAVFEVVLWCRPAAGARQSFAVGLAAPVSPEVLLWLSEAGEVQACSVLPSGAIALLIKLPGSLAAAFAALPAPQGGSRHESNYLPF